MVTAQVSCSIRAGTSPDTGGGIGRAAPGAVRSDQIVGALRSGNRAAQRVKNTLAGLARAVVRDKTGRRLLELIHPALVVADAAEQHDADDAHQELRNQTWMQQ